MKNKKVVIMVVTISIIVGGILYFTSTCNKPFIKGNISSSGEKIYHTPDGEYYSKTKIDRSMGERCFFSEKSAISAGWRTSLK
jgi:hypothetical protein